MVSPVNNNTAVVEYRTGDMSFAELDMRIDNIVARLFNMLAVKIQSLGVIITKSIHELAVIVGIKVQILVAFSNLST